MPVPTFKLAPLPLLVWAIWSQAAFSSDGGEMLMPHGDGNSLQTTASPLQEDASKAFPDGAMSAQASALEDKPLVPAGKEEAGAPSAPLPSQAVIPAVSTEPLPSPGNFPVPQSRHVSMLPQAAYPALPANSFALPPTAMFRPMGLGQMPFGPTPSFAPTAIPMMQQGWRPPVAMQASVMPALPRFPMFPAMPWLAPQMQIPAGVPLPRYPMPSMPMAMPVQGYPGMMPFGAPVMAMPAMPSVNRMPNFTSGGFPAPWGIPQFRPMAVPAPFPPAMAGFPAPWGMPQMPARFAPNLMPPVMAGFPPIWGLPRFPVPNQGNLMMPAMAMAPRPAPTGMPPMPLPVFPSVAASPGSWNMPGMAHQAVPMPQLPTVAMKMQSQPQETVLASSATPAPSGIQPVDTMQAMNLVQASVPSQAQMAVTQVSGQTQSNESVAEPIEVQAIEPPMIKAEVMLKEMHPSTAGAPETPVSAQSPISPGEGHAANVVTSDKAEAAFDTGAIAQAPAKAETPTQPLARAFPKPPVVGEAAFPSTWGVAKTSASFSQASDSREHQGPAAVEKVAAPRKLKVSDPCSENFRPIRSKVKRPKGKLMKTRKPAYDPCKGRYKSIRAKMS